MATIIPRGNTYSVVYRHEGEQKWESFKTKAEANRRKKQIEYYQSEGRFMPPTPKTVCDLMSDFVNMYGVKKWKGKGYTAKTGLINNYINPHLGDLKIDKVSKRIIDNFYTELEKTPSIKSQRKGLMPDEMETVTPRNIIEIHKVLKCAFNQAIGWELIDRNPVVKAVLPEVQAQKKRDIWDIETLFRAIDVCEDIVLEVALHLALCVAGREGELLGLQWDHVDVSMEAIENQESYVYIDRGLERVRKDALEATNYRGHIFTFPPLFASNVTDLCLMEPKTEGSIRKVWLPRTVALRLRELKEQQEEWQALYGDQYTDYGLVLCQPNGRPIEQRILLKYFKQLIADHAFPDVVFHSLRALSSTYKLKLNKGDLKATQGDTGHTTAKVLLDTYARVIDEDRKHNAIKMENELYNKPDPSEPNPTVGAQKLFEMLKDKPELAKAAEQFLTTLVNAAQPT